MKGTRDEAHGRVQLHIDLSDSELLSCLINLVLTD